MAARIRQHHTDEIRAKIQTSQLINRLQNQADGVLDLTPMQMKAIEILLRKTLPDLSAVEHSGGVEHRTARELTEVELDQRIADLSEREEAAATSAQQPVGVH